MTSGAYTSDHKPALGTDKDSPACFSLFMEWAKARRVENIALLISSQILLESNLRDPDKMLGGMLQFLSNRDTVELLRAWSPGHFKIAELANLGTLLAANFPEIRTPESTPEMTIQFPSCMNRNFLPAMLCVRRPPNLDSRRLYKFAAIRCFILIKAIDFQLQDSRQDKSIKEISDFVRQGGDWSGDRRKLRWLMGLIPSSLDLGDFRTNLEISIQSAETDVAGTTDALRALRHLTTDSRRPIESSTDAKRFSDVAGTNLSSFLHTENAATGNYFASFRQYDTTTTIDVPKSASPPEVSRLARIIAFQEAEDQQYLPFSWNRAREGERAALFEALAAEMAIRPVVSKKIDVDQTKLMAAIAIVALICQESLETISKVGIGSESTDYWQLDPHTLCLHRLAVRRESRWKVDLTSSSWVMPLQDRWEIQLLAHLSDVLRNALQLVNNPIALTDTWTHPTKSIALTFNQWCQSKEGLGRVTSGTLTRTCQQLIFEESKDAQFANLLTRRTNKGITGAGAYASWSSHAVRESQQKFAPAGLIHITDTNTDLNSLGSELNPIEELIQSAISDATKLLLNPIETKEPLWVRQHNLLAGYTVVMLLAATGARPVTSPFQSSNHFNFSNNFLFIEDKVSPLSKPGRSGRIVPVPSAAMEFVQNVWLRHLSALHDQFKLQMPELALEILKQAEGIGSNKLPLFFLLRNRPDFDWIEISESTLTALKLFDWPLPWNLFRHRLAIRLRTQKLDPELIDAQLGHSESGSETYGNYSPRCWQDDSPDWRTALDRAFNPLNFPKTLGVQPNVTDINIPQGYTAFPDESLFGAGAREKSRSDQRKRAKESAIEEIRAFVNKRPIDQIKPEEWERLGTNMLLRENNIPQANATIRFEAFERFIHDSWQISGLRPRFKTWKFPKPPSRTAFSEEAVHAKNKLELVRNALCSVIAVTHPGQVGRSVCAAIAALDVCLHSLISNKGLLLDIVNANCDAISLVIRNKTAFLEYTDAPRSASSFRPVARHAITPHCVAYITRALDAKKTLMHTAVAGGPLEPIAQALNWKTLGEISLTGMIEHVANLVDHENSLELPGLLAAVNAGRTPTFSLDRKDWIRAWTDQASIDPSDALVSQSEQHVEQNDHPKANAQTIKTFQIPRGTTDVEKFDTARKSARKLISDIRKVLTAFLRVEDANSTVGIESANIENTSNSTAKRKRRKSLYSYSKTENISRVEARRDIQLLIDASDDSISTTIHAFARWVLQLLSRENNSKLLDVASVKTYMDRTAHGFTSFAHSIDIADLDEDELTELYQQVIDPSISVVEDGPDNVDGLRTTIKTRKDQVYVLHRIKEFHTFAEIKYGLTTPDWSEIGEGLTSATASPGIITEREYQHAFSTLCNGSEYSHIDRLADAFILLLTYRFGLRGGEAIGLMRHEWVEVKDTIVVLVTHRFHKLKSRAAQRQIPLLVMLTALEKKVVLRWIDHWDTENNSNPNVPLFFFEKNAEYPRDIRPIRTRLIAAIRAATQNQRTNLHHARHSFANSTGLSIIAPKLPSLWSSKFSSNCVMAESNRKLLLGTNQSTRRSIWAIARCLGHAGPQTFVGAYGHFAHDWASTIAHERFPDRFNFSLPKARIGIDDLDLWQISQNYLAPTLLKEAPPLVDLTPGLAMRYMELRSQGKSDGSVIDHLRLKPAVGQLFEKSLSLVGMRLLAKKVSSDRSISRLVNAHGLLGKIQAHRWEYLTNLASSLDQVECPTTIDLGSIIGHPQQLLIWKRAHFELLNLFLKNLRWSLDQVTVYKPKSINPELIDLAKSFDLELNNTHTANGKKIFQVAKVYVLDSEGNEFEQPNRVGLVRSPTNTSVADNFEFIAIWLAVIRHRQ